MIHLYHIDTKADDLALIRLPEGSRAARRAPSRRALRPAAPPEIGCGSAPSRKALIRGAARLPAAFDGVETIMVGREASSTRASTTPRFSTSTW